MVTISVRCGVFKMVEDVCRPPALQAGYLRNSCKAVLAVTRLQGVEALVMTGPGKSLGSPWPPLAICYDGDPITFLLFSKALSMTMNGLNRPQPET
jgi:hypothetical protein